MTATLTSPRIRTDCDPDMIGYWLRHCHGFQVFGQDGRLGFVEAVEDDDANLDIVIAAGLFRPRTLVSHERDVAELNVSRRELVVTQFEQWDESYPRRWSDPGSIGFER